MLEYDAKASGFQSATTTNPTPAFSSVLPIPAWQGAFSFGAGGAFQVTNKQQVTTTATLTTSSAHSLTVGQTITVANVGAPFDGTWVTIAGTTGSTVAYTVPTGSVVSTPVSPVGYVSGVTGTLQTGNISLKRTVTPIFTIQGRQTPYQVFQGPLSADGALTFVTEDDTQLTQYLTNTVPAIDLCFQNGTGAALLAAQFHMNRAAYKVGKVERGKEYVETTINYKAFGNTSDVGASLGQGLIKAVLRNAKTTAVYA
jgi:hypothetical protein